MQATYYTGTILSEVWLLLQWDSFIIDFLEWAEVSIFRCMQLSVLIRVLMTGACWTMQMRESLATTNWKEEYWQSIRTLEFKMAQTWVLEYCQELWRFIHIHPSQKGRKCWHSVFTMVVDNIVEVVVTRVMVVAMIIVMVAVMVVGGCGGLGMVRIMSFSAWTVSFVCVTDGS